MVRSRKNALVTAIIALILVAAVVLAVVFLGDGAIYTPGGQEATASNAAVEVNASTGTVPDRDQYIFETLTEHSEVGSVSNWSNYRVEGEQGVYQATLDSHFYLLSDYDYNGHTSLTPHTPGVGNGMYTLEYNGSVYRFLNGNSGFGDNDKRSSLYRTFTMFMTDSSFYQNTKVYGLIFTSSVSYNPNKTYNLSWFDATLDGAGATISPSEVLKIDDNFNGEQGWPHEGNPDSPAGRTYASGVAYIKNSYLGHEQMTRNENGTGFAGLLFGAVRNGTFMNFQWTDKNISGTHSYILQTEQYGTAFGGLVGLAANSSENQSTSVKSSIYNVSMSFNKNIVHEMRNRKVNFNDNKAIAQCDIYSGGLIGINLNADIELVSINYNSIKFNQNAARLQWRSVNNPGLAWGTSSFGGVVGVQSSKNNMTFTFSKVTLSANSDAALVGDDWILDGGGYVDGYVSTVYTQQGAIFGSVNGNLTLDGIILDMNYDNIYTWWDLGSYSQRDNTSIQRGIMAGHIYDCKLTYKNIYITDRILGGSYTSDAVGSLDKIGTNSSVGVTDSHFGDYTAYYAYIGGQDSNNEAVSTSRAFIYADQKVISSINFAYVDPDKEFGSGEIEPVIEITYPENTEKNPNNYPGGVMWDVTYYEHGNSTNKLAAYEVFMQNSATDVQVGTVDTFLSNQYLEMAITYASSYNYRVSNMLAGQSVDKVYDKTRVNYPTLDVDVKSEISSYGDDNLLTGDGYMTLLTNANGTITLRLNNGSYNIGKWGISSYYDANGTGTGNNDLRDIAGSVLQLESNTSSGYQRVNYDQWQMQYNVNTYRWSTLGLFAFKTTTNLKYVFAPISSTAEVKITQRPLYVDVVNNSVTYNANPYNLATTTGGAGTTDNVIDYNIATTATADGTHAIISGDNVSINFNTLTAIDSNTYEAAATSLGGSSAMNYQLVAAPDSANTFTINPASVTLTVTGGSATYGFTKPANAAEFMEMVEYSFASSNSTLTNFASRDNITVNMNIQTGTTASDVGQWLLARATGSGTVFAHNFPAGDYTVTYEGLTGTGLNNYTVVTFDNTTPFKVEKAPLVVTLPSISGFTYGDAETPTVGAPSYNGLMGNDSVTGYEVLYYTSQDDVLYETRPFGAGNYYALANITAISSAGSVSGVNNYAVQANQPAFTVAKRDTQVQFDYDPDNALIYKGSAHTFNATALTNAAFTDGNNIADTVTFQAYSDVNRQNEAEATNAGIYYPGAVSAALSANYNITGVRDANGYEWTSFEVLKATITVNAQTQTIEYSGSEVVYDTSNVTIEGEVSGEEELIRNAIAILYNGSSAVPVDAGTYSVTVQIDGLANYNAVNVTLNDIFKINPMTVHIVVTKAQDGQISAVYSGINIPAIAYTVQNDEGTEITEATLPVNISYANEEGTSPVSSLRNVGKYTVTFTYDGSDTNYVASGATSIKYIVTPKQLTIDVDGVTGGAATQVYNKAVYAPGYSLTGIVPGDTVNAIFNSTEGTIQNADEYNVTVTLDNGNYSLTGETAYTLTITPFILKPQPTVTSLLINTSNLSPDYYLDMLGARVLDADGTDASDDFEGNITFAFTGLSGNINSAGGQYETSLTISSLPERFKETNYKIGTADNFTVSIYRLGLNLGFMGDVTSVTYGKTYALLGSFIATAGSEDSRHDMTVSKKDDSYIIHKPSNPSSVIEGVTSITINSATLTYNVSYRGGGSATNNKVSDMEDIFINGVYNATNMARAGEYSASLTVSLTATYSSGDIGSNDIIMTVPFNWTLAPKVIRVTLNTINSVYYTDTITTTILERGLSYVDEDEELKSYIVVTSPTLGSTPDAGEHSYSIAIDTTEGGYNNYALPGTTTGTINVQPLTLQVSVNNNEVQYGYAPTQGATASVTVLKGSTPVKNTAAIEREYSYTITAVEYEGNRPVNTYTDALTANVTATHNFTVETATGDLTVVPRQLSIVLGAISMSYSDASLPAVTYTLTGNVGLVSGDPLPAIIGNTLKINNEVFSDDINKLDANTYTYTYESVTSDNANYTMTISSGGTLTVNPYQITSVTWVEPTSTLIYKGDAFSSDELFSVQKFTNENNGDVVTFSVSYGDGVAVKNADAYTASVAVASVSDGSAVGNYSVSGVAARSFSVAKADLSLTSVRGAAYTDGAAQVTTTYNTLNQGVTQGDLAFAYGASGVYLSENDGELTVSIAHTQNLASATPVNAGTYNVTITVSGTNFNTAEFAGVSLVINRWVLTAEEFASNLQVNLPANSMYDSAAKVASLNVIEGSVLANVSLAPEFTYYTVTGNAEDGYTVSSERTTPVNAGTYQVMLTIDTVNVYYTTPGEGNEDGEGRFTISPTTAITLDVYVEKSAGLEDNQVYYDGTSKVPVASATVQLTTTQYIYDSSAFTFKIYEVSNSADGADLSDKYPKLPAHTYYVAKDSEDNIVELQEALSSGAYYVFVTFNEGSNYNSNYASAQTWMMSNGDLVAMQITKGNMSMSIAGGLTGEYNGLVGYNGRDVIYQDADGKWQINTEIIQFSGINIAGMSDLTYDLKTGDIVITVYYNRGRTNSGELLYTALYTYTWGYDPNANNGEGKRSTPVKRYLPVTLVSTGQITGPANGVYDFGYAGYNAITEQVETALYRIDISVDNTTGSGSEYSPALTVKYNDEGEPIITDGVAQTEETAHTASGAVNITPADIEFNMNYTSDFYNDGANALAGGYHELNSVISGLLESGDEALADYILRGTSLPISVQEGEFVAQTGYKVLTKPSDTDETRYSDATVVNTRTQDVKFAKYYTQDASGVQQTYEDVDSATHISVTNPNGDTVYIYGPGGSHYSQGGGITNAGEYIFTFTFDGIEGKYEPFTYQGLFIQQKAEYHITVSQREGANLTTTFGTEFDLNNLENALEVKLEHEEGDFTTNTGHYQAFEDAFNGVSGDINKFIRLVSNDSTSDVASEYPGYTASVGLYFIYYVYISQDPNLEIMMETVESMITVNHAQPDFLAYKDEILDENGATLDDQSYRANYVWNNDILSQLQIGVYYKYANGEKIEGVEPYYSSAVSENVIEYRENSETGVWGRAGTVSSVGEYRLTIQANTAADGNLSGEVKPVIVQVPVLDENDEPVLDENDNPQTRPEERTVYVYFTINKIAAAAALTGVDAVDGSDYTGSSFTLGYSVTSGGNSVDSSALGGTVSILVYYGTERPAEDSEFKDIKDLPILNAGTYWVKVVVENSANYTVTPSDLSQIVINKADLNISFSNTAGGYTQTYSEEGFTLPENAFHFELNGSIHTYEDIASDYAVYYLRGANGSDVNAFVEAYYKAGSEVDIVDWLAEQQTDGNYTGYEFTFVGDKAAATDATDGENYYDYFPVVVYNGNDNFNKYAHLVTNGSYPLITITKALLTLSAGSYVNEGIDKPFAIVYGTELYEGIAQGDATYNIDDYVTLRWTYSNGTTVGADDAALADAAYSYSLLTMNRYSSSNNNAGTYDDAFELSVNYKHNNYDFAYDPFYVDLIVSPKEITIDLNKATAWLGSNPDDVKNLSADVLFSHTYNGEVYGPLTFDLDTAGLGILDKDNTAAKTDANGFGTYGIFDVSATNTFANAATAGTFTGNMTITLNNANYTLAGNAAGTISVPVTLNIEKAVLRIDFDLITYKMGETSYKDSVDAGTGDHLGWYEYHTIYNGSRFVENDRVYVQSGTWDGTSFTPFGAWSEKTPIGGDILSNFSISYGASGNVAAVGEYNIHIALVNPNYKFIDSANNTLGTDASGAQVDLTTQDINVTISPSEAVQIVNSLGGVGGIFTSGTAGEYIRIFDGTSINVNLLKDYLELYAYRKDVTDGSTLKGSLSGNDPVVMVSGTDMLANVINRQATITIKDASGTEVSRIMNAGNYTVTISLNSSTHIMDDVTYNIVITPTDDITSEVSVKSRTKRTYNGTDMKPSLSVTITVTDFYLNDHTIAVSDYTVVGYKMVESEGDVLTRPDAPTFTYEVSGGVADYTTMAGLMTDAGTYELVVKFENANIGSAAGEITVGEHFVINPRSLTDSGIASTYTEVFDYTGTALTAEDLGVRVVYNRETDLVMGTDYTITLSDSIYTGHYTFTINGIGNYNDSIGGAYDIGASMGIETAPEAITYGDDSLTITMKVNSLAEGMSAAGLILTFAEGSSARLVSKAANSEATFTVALLSVPSGAINVTGDSITITLTGFGAVPATIEGTDYYLDLSFRCEYNDIAANGAINMNTNAETAKVVVNPADMEEVAQTVSVTTMSVNSTNMSFNISGTPNVYEYSVDNGQTWRAASKGVNLISNLTAGTEFTVQVRINDTNYETDAGEHTAVVATLTGTTTTGVQEVIDMASSLADNFNASGFDAYVELMQLVASLSSADRANNAAALEAAIAEVEEARAAYIEDLQDAVDNAVHAAELAAGKSTTTSASTVGLAAAGGIALPMLGIGMLFAARRKKNKEDDLND